jgi:hypothetical protein
LGSALKEKQENKKKSNFYIDIVYKPKVIPKRQMPQRSWNIKIVNSNSSHTFSIFLFTNQLLGLC